MMPEDIEDHVAQMFHGLVADLQQNDVAVFEEKQKLERMQRSLLRQSQPYQGLTAGELLKKLDGDPAEDQKRIERELQRMDNEARTAAANKAKTHETLPKGHFPPPPKSG